MGLINCNCNCLTPTPTPPNVHEKMKEIKHRL